MKELREKIQNGTYEVDASRVADKILGSLFTDKD